MDVNNWYKVSMELTDCAMGRTAADLVIRNGTWVCVQTGEIIPHIDIAVKGERIAFVGADASHTVGENTRQIEANGRYMVPGLLDAHMHVESGMLNVTEFVRAVLPHGTTGMFIDPHEIANVFGLEGIRLMVDEAAAQPIHVWVQVPSCVPSAPGFETPGAVLEVEEVGEALQWKGVIGLGEVMNFPGVVGNDKKMHREMATAKQLGKVIGGHYASPDLTKAFHAYAAAGPQDDHEGTRLEDALARARQGMKVMMRYGSAWHDVVEQVRAVTEMHLDWRNFLLCTDDAHSGTLVNEGHVDRALRHAIAQGLPPMRAIQMATINTAEHFGLAQDIGQIAPKRYADVILTSDLVHFRAEVVIAKGRVAVESGEVVVDMPTYTYPKWATQSVKLQHALSSQDFRINAPDGEVLTANVIGIIENQAPTRHIRMQVHAKEGEVTADIHQDVAKVALVERHKGSGKVQMGLVQGFGFNQPCAVATTVAHDSHQMIIVGTDDQSMAAAGNELARCGGGQVVVLKGQVIAVVELPIGGLMTSERAEIVGRKAANVLQAFKTCGCQLNNPNMQLSLLALVVIPSLRISDLGLVDVEKFEFIPIVE